MNHFKNNLSAILLLTVVLIFAGCATVPITGRKQVTMFPESQMMAISLNQYSQFLKKNKLSSNKAQTAMVKRVGNKIAKAVESYLQQNGLGARVANFKWEFNLVDSNVPNAWCMPGGKVVFYTGILPYTKTEAGLAVVMGHEIAHAVAKHGNERMTQQAVVTYGSAALSTLYEDKPKETKNLLNMAVGAAGTVGVMLPFSRTHEHEADKLGAIFMAMAGYNPSEAAEFWKRMTKLSGTKKSPEFLSTHPSDQSRINNLETFLPEAMKYYKKN